jgi:hypothetical protein
LWQSKMTHLTTWFYETETCPPLAKAIIDNFNAWRAGARRPITSSRYPGLQRAVQRQHRIGWRAAFEGRWATEFMEIQQSYFRFLCRRRTGRRWLVSLIKKCWEVAWSMWDHRNKVQERVREDRQCLELKQQVHDIFRIGPNGLHMASRRLFTYKSEEERLRQNTASLRAWVLRVQAAQARAILDPYRLEREEAALLLKEQQQAKQAQRLRQLQLQQNMFLTWRRSSS